MKDLSQFLIPIAQAWQDPDYYLRRQAIELSTSEFCLSKISFEQVLEWIFEQWTEKNIMENQRLIKSQLLEKHHYVVQILAGTTPAMIAQGFFQGTLLNIPQYIKLPRAQTQFAHFLYQSFIEHSCSFSDLFELNDGQNLLPFYEKLSQADLVIAYGQDETMSILQSYIAPNTVFIAHGHAQSAAIIFNEAIHVDSLEKLADDMLSYDQRGCLSPRVVLIEQGGELNPSECARVFAENILPQAIKKWPRGQLFSGEAAEILHQRIRYRFRGIVYASEGSDWTVCFDEKSVWPEESLPRFLPFKPLEEMIIPPLISVGYAGSSEKMARLNQTLKTRVCALGEMQKQLLVF